MNPDDAPFHSPSGAAVNAPGNAGKVKINAKKLLILSADDNVAVALDAVGPGRIGCSDGSEIEVSKAVTLGQKIARRAIRRGEKIIKYGVSIGSATADIAPGEYVHIHNLKSDYTPTHALDETAGGLDGGVDGRRRRGLRRLKR